MRAAFAIALLLAAASHGQAADKPPRTRLWNLTGETIAKFEMSPAGKTEWGSD